MRAPAVCNNCGTIFPSGMEFSNSTNITFSGCGWGPCPNCGGDGHIPDGVYNFIDNTIELLSGPSRTISELKRLSDILTQAKRENNSFDEITEKINKELPSLSSLKDVLPRTRSELYAFTSIIIAIIALLIGQLKDNSSQPVEINQVFNTIYQQQVTPEKKPPPKVIRAKKIKVGRNDRCPCGSGIKYKKCCLNKKA